MVNDKFWKWLATCLLLCFTVSALPCNSLFCDQDRGATECTESPAPANEEDEVKHARPFASHFDGLADPGTPVIAVVVATDDNLLPSPHGEVLVEPPEQRA